MQVTMMPKQPSMPLSEVQPDPQLEKRSRRVFTTDYKLKILAQADQCAGKDVKLGTGIGLRAYGSIRQNKLINCRSVLRKLHD